MTAPAGPPAEEVTVSAEEVRSVAVVLGVTTPLRRLTAEGLIAAPRSRGRGRGRGREYRYPARVRDQLAAVAEARNRSRRYAALRHMTWWSPDGQLEDWSLWQRDGLAVFAVQCSAWALPEAHADEFPAERERHVTEVAEGLQGSRMRGLPRKRLHTLDDTVTYVRLGTSLILRDDQLVPLEADGAEEHWRRVAAEPVDNDDSGAVGGTMGQLFQRGVGWQTPSSDGSGFGALACAAMVQPPVVALAILASMTEGQATRLRDVVLELAERNGSAGVLREQPAFAAIALVTMAAIDWVFPGRLEGRVAA